MMKREVKEGAELVTYDAHKGFHVCRINQSVREDSVGRWGGSQEENSPEEVKSSQR